MLLPFKLFKKELQRSDCFKPYLDYTKFLMKLDNCALRITFLENCKSSDIVPKFLTFRIPQNGCFDDDAVHNFQIGLLNREISKARSNLNDCTDRLNEKRNELRTRLPQHSIPAAVVYSRIDRVQNRQKVAATHLKKLSHLSKQQEKPLFNIENTVKIIDVSVPIPKYVIQTLQMGPRNPVIQNFNDKDVLSELDSFLNFCKENYVSDSCMNDINVKTLNYIKACKKQKTARHLILTQKFLKTHDLVAVPFDKGIGFCIMPKSTYEQKLNPIIDLPQFQKIDPKRKNAKHPVLKEEERVVNVLNDLKKNGHISEKLYNKLKPTGSQPPRLYGLAKVHKEGTPLRPIVSMPGSAYQQVAKQVAAWLSLVPECGINTSTEKVSAQIKSQKLQPDECLVSFDVVSLYTNVPVKESIQVCADLLFKKVKLSITKDTFIQLAELACCNVIFSTHRGHFVQTDGLAMGSPPAPCLANGWLSQFEKTIKASSILYYRYMDDIFCECKISDVDDRLKLLNSLHSNLSFTIEKEHCGKLSFLDMIIFNDNGNLSSGWFRKSTDTGLTLNYHSIAPLKYKKSVIISFVYRIFRACSTWQQFDIGLNEAMTILRNNQYPDSFFFPIIHATIVKLVTVNNDDVDNSSVNNLDLTLDPNACLISMDRKDKFKFFLEYRGKPTDLLAKAFHKLNAPCTVIMTTRKLKIVCLH